MIKKNLIYISFLLLSISCVNNKCPNDISLIPNNPEISYYSLTKLYKNNELRGYKLNNIKIESLNFLFDCNVIDTVDYIICKDIYLNNFTLQTHKCCYYLELSNSQINSFDLKNFNIKILCLFDIQSKIDTLEIDNAYLTQLNLTGGKFKSIKFINVPLLQQIMIFGNDIQKIDTSFYLLKNLERIEIGRTDIKTIKVHYFPKLRYLKIDSAFYNLNKEYLDTLKNINLEFF